MERIIAYELKTCPYCGSDCVYLIYLDHIPRVCYVECGDCESRGPKSRFFDIAVKEWNRLAHEMDA